MSASTTPTERPRAASATARLTVSEDLPTPPLPEATAYTRVSEPGLANGISFSTRPGPRSSSCSWRRWSALITSSSTCTPVTPSSGATAAVTSRVMVSRSGQPEMVRKMPTVTVPSGSTRTSLTMPSSVTGRRISGSRTDASAAVTCSAVTTGPAYADSRVPRDLPCSSAPCPLRPRTVRLADLPARARHDHPADGARPGRAAHAAAAVVRRAPAAGGEPAAPAADDRPGRPGDAVPLRAHPAGGPAVQGRPGRPRVVPVGRAGDVHRADRAGPDPAAGGRADPPGRHPGACDQPARPGRAGPARPAAAQAAAGDGGRAGRRLRAGGVPAEPVRRRLTGARRSALDLLAHLVQVVAQLRAQEVTGGDLADGDPDGRQLPGQVLDVGAGALGDLPVLVEADPVPVGLPVLCQQDQRGGVRGLQGQRQGQEDERELVEPQMRRQQRVPADPADHHDRLQHQEPGRADEPRDGLGEPAERLGVVARPAPAHPPGLVQPRLSHRGPAPASPRAAGGPARRPR